MKRLTGGSHILKITLLSLPAVLLAVALVIYGLTFMPLSAVKMKGCVALVEHVSYYEISAGGKPQVWFRAFGDSLTLCDAATTAGGEAAQTTLQTGVFVNRYGFMPSCRGRILAPIGDSLTAQTLAAANKSVAVVVERAAAGVEKLIAKYDREAVKLHYYLSTHNVNDDGYNTMAAYSAASDSSRKKAAALLDKLKAIAAKTDLGIRRIDKYTLLYYNSQGKLERKPCVDLTTQSSKRFHILQTEDQRTPNSAAALYFHQWLTPSVDVGGKVCLTSFHGSTLPTFSTDSVQAGFFFGLITKQRSHNVPPLFAPDGSPVFTSGGRLAGVSIGQTVVPVSCFNFGFNDLLP